MSINRVFIILFSLFLAVLNIFSQEEADKAEDSVPSTQFATIDVLVVFYTNTAGAQISTDEIMKLKNGIPD